MQIIKEIYSENCFDGTFIKDYELSNKIKPSFIDFLKNAKGKLFCLENLTNPFFTFESEDYFTLKGIVNDNELRVIYIREQIDKGEEILKKILEEHQNSSVSSNN